MSDEPSRPADAPTRRVERPEDPTPVVDAVPVAQRETESSRRASRSSGLTHLKGIEQPSEIGRLLAQWQSAVTTDRSEPRFQLAGQLGSGSQGIVFRVVDRDCRREVALKSLRSSDPEQGDISRFVHEAQITAQLEHPGIVPVHDFGMLPDGTVFYTMKRVEGRSLAEWMEERRGRVAHRFALLDVFVRVCETVGFAHSKGVIHRDLKPRNIMVGSHGEVLVMDWGLAKIVGSEDPGAVTSLRSDVDSETDIHRTMAGFAVGTPAYMAPEQARGESHLVDQRSDVYALGVILYEMLVGDSPYIRGNVRRTLDQAASGTIRPFHDAKVGGRALAAIIRKAMAHDRGDRYRGAEELAADIRAFIAGQAVSAHRESPFERAQRFYRRHRLAIVAAGVVAAAALGLAIAWQVRGHLREERDIVAWREDGARAEAAGDLDTARKDYERILVLRPADRGATQRLAAVEDGLRQRIAEDEARRVREAAAALRRQAELVVRDAAPEDEAPLNQAAELYLKALGLTPRDDALLAGYNAVVQRSAALEEARKARALEAENARRATELARAAAEARAAGRLQDAVGLAEAAQHLRSTAEVRALLRELDAALDAAARSEAAARRRQDADGFAGRARAALDAGDAGAAARLVEQVRGVDPDHPQLAALGQAVAAAEQALQERRADALLQEASTLLTQAGADARRLEELAAEVAARQAELLDNGSPEARAALRALEAGYAELERRRSAALAQAIGGLHRANAAAPGYAPARAALAGYFVARMLEAEAVGDEASAQAAEAQARIFDDGSHAKMLDGIGTLELEPGSQACEVRRLVPQSDRRDGPDGESLRLEPGRALDLAHGRWLLIGDGVRTAVRLARGERRRIALAPPPRCQPGARWIPPGTIYAADRRALRWVAGFALMEREVTCGEWLEFLNDGATRKELVERLKRGEWAFVPREGGSAAMTPLWRQRGALGRLATGTFVLELADGTAVDPHQPVSGISAEDAMTYATWRSARDGVAWRLPSRDEWILAVQGGDGRRHPWGDAADPSLCHSIVGAARLGARGPLAGGSFATDSSVQGVLDLAGSLVEYVADSGPGGMALVVGGSRADRQPDRFACWSRRELPRTMPNANAGVRLAYTP